MHLEEGLEKSRRNATMGSSLSSGSILFLILIFLFPQFSHKYFNFVTVNALIIFLLVLLIYKAILLMKSCGIS